MARVAVVRGGIAIARECRTGDGRATGASHSRRREQRRAAAMEHLGIVAARPGPEFPALVLVIDEAQAVVEDRIFDEVRLLMNYQMNYLHCYLNSAGLINL